MIRRSTAAWLVVAYLALALLPLALAILPPRPTGRSFVLELSMALGFIGLGQLALQFGLIARYERISRPFGIDLVMQYHRQLGMIAIGLVVAHVALLAVSSPLYRRLLNPLEGDLASRAGLVSTFCWLLLMVLSLWRTQLRVGYELWRISHGVLAVGALLLAVVHVWTAGRYIDVPWKATALTMWTVLLLGVILHLRMIKPAQLGRKPWEVVEVRAELGNTWTLGLSPVGHPGLHFAPGQFAWLKLGSPWSIDEHPFSFSSSADRHGRVEFGIKELGDFSGRIGQVPLGTRAFLDGPHGSFSTDFILAPGYVLIAGGIGISPLLSILRTLADRNDERPHLLIYACSRLDRAAFDQELDALEQKLRLQTVRVLEHPPPGWNGPAGYITASLLSQLLPPGDGRHVLMCGPDVMMTAVESSLREAGVPEERIHMERFVLV
jgi:predicted ferric reductase